MMTKGKQFVALILAAAVFLLLMGSAAFTVYLYSENKSQNEKLHSFDERVASLETELEDALENRQATPDEFPTEEAPPAAAEPPVQEDIPEGSPELSVAEPEPTPGTEALPYMELYPDTYAEYNPDAKDSPGVIYLTFDDGPSRNTETILNVLKAHNVKATFFVVADSQLPDWKVDLLKRMVSEGHTIGVHSASHVYKTIYASVDAFLADFNTAYQAVYSATGVRPWAFRFPGGSINSYNLTTYQEIISEMSRRGFVYYDWNCSAQDASNKVTSEEIWNNMVRNLSASQRNILLLHDTKTLTVNLLDRYITEMEAKGYTFAELTPDVQPVFFAYKDNGGTDK